MKKPYTNRQVFSRQELFVHYKLSDKSDAVRRYALARLINGGIISRIGRDQYCLKDSLPKKYNYVHLYSDYAIEIAKLLCEKYPILDWCLFETTSLNEFMNHQIAKNTLFVEAEPMIVESVYETLRGKYAEKVLVKPGPKDIDYYWADSTIIVMRLVSEAPKDSNVPYGTTLEKMLVDLFANKVLMNMISRSEYTVILEDAFQRYNIDEIKMFRYARRRNAEKRMKEYIRQNTRVKLMTD